MAARDTIGFLRRGSIVEHAVANPMQTVLDYLRLEEKSRGTKEGCNEGIAEPAPLPLEFYAMIKLFTNRPMPAFC